MSVVLYYFLQKGTCNELNIFMMWIVCKMLEDLLLTAFVIEHVNAVNMRQGE
jgi:hypothetical protein